jgi:hypothetical protein
MNMSRADLSVTPSNIVGGAWNVGYHWNKDEIPDWVGDIVTDAFGRIRADDLIIDSLSVNYGYSNYFGVTVSLDDLGGVSLLGNLGAGLSVTPVTGTVSSKKDFSFGGWLHDFFNPTDNANSSETGNKNSNEGDFSDRTGGFFG